jgi:hypothetical protein
VAVRSENISRTWQSRTAEERRQQTQAARDAINLEALLENAAYMNSLLTYERRCELTKEAAAKIPFEVHQARMLHAQESITHEQRIENGKKGAFALTPEQRLAANECGTRALLAQSSDKRKANARKAADGQSPEKRSENARKANAAQTPEQHTQRMQKAWATRRARYGQTGNKS